MRRCTRLLLLVVLGVVCGCNGPVQRQFLFFPTHRVADGGLQVWRENGREIGLMREVAEPDNVWLLLHGNGGQAADRTYALPRFSTRDGVFILEYPGYGQREGRPSRAALDAAAIEAFAALRRRYPGKAIGIAGESLGSGPACGLAHQPEPPEKIVLLVLFDSLKRVASERVAWLPAAELLGDVWDNGTALAGYRGVVEIFAARNDRIIPVKHACALAATVPGAKLHVFDGGHNDWAAQHSIEIRMR